MQEDTMTSFMMKEPESKMVITDGDKDADISRPSINTAPLTLDGMTMERAVAAAQKIFAEDPSQDFTKDAIDAATRENAPAKDAGDANPLGSHLDGLIQKAGNAVDTNFTQSKAAVPTEAPAAPPPISSMEKPHRPNSDPN